MTIDFETYKKKVFGCYVGKCVGGTLGMKYEGNLNYNPISYYNPIPDKMVPNDDLDLQVVNFESLLCSGLPICRYNIGDIWKYHMVDTAPDEYGVALSNHALKINAPLSGIYRNGMNDGMGGAIRSELWACLAPCNPALAVSFAKEDACNDHYGVGVHAEMFLSAVESAAFYQTDLYKLINIGLEYIPNDSQLKHAFLDVIKWFEQGLELIEIRELILQNYHSKNWTNVVINLSFIILALLVSKGDFDTAICTATSLGYDADCTAATVGSIFGIMAPEKIGKKWTAPIGNSLVLSAGIINMHTPSTIDEFCMNVISVADSVQKYYGTGIELNLPEDFPKAKLAKPYLKNFHAIYDWKENSNESLIMINPLVASLVYPDTIGCIPDKENQFILKIDNVLDKTVSFELDTSLPIGWTCDHKPTRYTLAPNKRIEIPFVINVEKNMKRVPLNVLKLFFNVDGIQFIASAGLPVAYQWLRENLDTGVKEIIEEPSVFFNVPKGRYKYTAKLFSPMGKDVKIYVGCLRRFKFFFNKEEIFDSTSHYSGALFIPCFHRSGAKIVPMLRRNNVMEIVFEDGEEKTACTLIGTVPGCSVWLDSIERLNFDEKTFS